MLNLGCLGAVLTTQLIYPDIILASVPAVTSQPSSSLDTRALNQSLSH